VGVTFREHHERAGWSVADAVRATERNAGQKTPDLKTKLPSQKTNPEHPSAASKLIRSEAKPIQICGHNF